MSICFSNNEANTQIPNNLPLWIYLLLKQPEAHSDKVERYHTYISLIRNHEKK